jgi:hypothetical protein
MAAHESRMEASRRALAQAHGIAAEAFEKSVEAVRKIGYHGEDAIHTIDRLIIADLDLLKAAELAKVAKDAAAIQDIAAPEALEQILQAIKFGNARALRLETRTKAHTPLPARKKTTKLALAATALPYD